MKKMMMMVAAMALLAVGANAGQIQWSVSGVRTHDALTGSADGATTLNNGTSLQGAIVYLFVGSLDAGAIHTAIQSNPGTFNTALANASVLTTTAGATGVQLYGNYVSQNVTAYAVIFDGGAYNPEGEGNYWISSAVTQSFGATGNKLFSFVFSSTANWTHYNNVPEPTSLALLAIGAAVVGLRRRFKA